MQVDPVRLDGGVGEGEGSERSRMPRSPDGLYAVAQDLGRYADRQPIHEPGRRKAVIRVAPPSTMTDPTPSVAERPQQGAQVDADHPGPLADRRTVAPRERPSRSVPRGRGP